MRPAVTIGLLLSLLLVPWLVSDEKPATRTDLAVPDFTGKDESRAESAASSPAASGNNAGTGGRNAGQGGGPQRTDAASTSPEAASPPSGTPPTIESSGASGAQGGTKPPENTNVGNPRGPQ